MQYAGMFLMQNGTDFAQLDSPEQCNSHLGFREGSPLCHHCKNGWYRESQHSCALCAESSALLLIVGAVLIIAILALTVRNWIQDAGKIYISSSMQKCILSYFQVAALFSNFSLQWPDSLSTIFKVEGAISTAGEYFLNPNCAVREAYESDASLYYGKQIAYSVLPPAFVGVSYAFWKVYAMYTGEDWGKTRKVTNPQKPVDRR